MDTEKKQIRRQPWLLENLRKNLSSIDPVLWTTDDISRVVDALQAGSNHPARHRDRAHAEADVHSTHDDLMATMAAPENDIIPSGGGSYAWYRLTYCGTAEERWQHFFRMLYGWGSSNCVA